MAERTNPLLSDRNVDFLLYELHDVERLCALPAFAEHGRETFDLFLASARRFAKEVLFPSYRAIDESPARLKDGRISAHPSLHPIFRQMVELGLITATRPAEVGGMMLPMAVAGLGHAYLMAGNLSAYGYIGLTTGAAHLVETFGSADVKARFMEPMYAGRWTGTMALTEPQAGSSLADVTTKATPAGEHYLVSGAKIFISGGDHDLTENVVNLTLARIDGAPPGTKGLSLFAIPNRRPESGALVDNDVRVAGAIHKIGWRGLPSLVLSLGERGDCRGWLVGEKHRGIAHMFQMMNEARIMVGMNAAATASVAYYESLAYAEDRPQGRPVAARDPKTPQVPIIQHADVRRMLLRQKAIVEGSLALLVTASLNADLAAHAVDPAEKQRAQELLDLLTPVAKSFPAEWGFESNALALQIHGGYGYSSEYLPEAWLRDQKLNSIHEGTTGIHSLDLLGRKVVARGGASLQRLVSEVAATSQRARAAGVDGAWCDAVERASATVAELTLALAQAGLAGDPERMLRHSVNYLQLFSIWVVAWQWLAQAAAAHGKPGDFYEGKRCAAQYFILTELPRVTELAALCRSGEDSFARMKPAWF